MEAPQVQEPNQKEQVMRRFESLAPLAQLIETLLHASFAWRNEKGESQVALVWAASSRRCSRASHVLRK